MAKRIGLGVVAAFIVCGIGVLTTAGPAMANPPSTFRVTVTSGAGSAVSTTPIDGPTPVPERVLVPTSTPTPTKTPTPTPTGEQTSVPVPDEDPTQPPLTPQPSPDVDVPRDDVETPSPPAVDDGQQNGGVPDRRLAQQPTVTVTQIPWPSILLAVLTLALSGIAILVIARRGRARETARQDAFVGAAPVVDAEGSAPSGATAASAASDGSGASGGSARTLAAMIATGEAMIDGGYPVDRVQDALEDIARVNGESAAEIITLPTAVLISLRSGDTVVTEAAASGRASLLLFQLEALDTAVEEARNGSLAPTGLLVRLRAIRRLVPPSGFLLRLSAYVVQSIGLAVLLDGSWAGVALAGLLGGFVGALMLLGAYLESRYQVLLTVAAAFAVSLVVFLVARTEVDLGIMPSLVAPLVMLLPGALLTTGVIELSTGEIIAGSARLAAGAMRLVLLAFGIAAAAALVGVPRVQLDGAAQPLGPVAPWIGVALFGVGLVFYQCARLRSLPWILLVLYVAYGAQVIGGVFLGAVLSAAVGALVMTPIAALVARQPTGPPAIVTFLPAFWLLVPGALGLVGVTSLWEGDSSGLATLTTTVATMVSITLGVLVGLGLSGLATRAVARAQKASASAVAD